MPWRGEAAGRGVQPAGEAPAEAAGEAAGEDAGEVELTVPVGALHAFFAARLV